MAEGCQRQAWDHTATLLAWIGNNNPYRRSKTFHPSEFHPYMKRQRMRQFPESDKAEFRKMFGND